jgi:hypothetical protein
MYTVIKRGRNQPSISTAFSIHLAELYEALAALSFFAGDGKKKIGRKRFAGTSACLLRRNVSRFGAEFVITKNLGLPNKFFRSRDAEAAASADIHEHEHRHG